MHLDSPTKNLSLSDIFIPWPRQKNNSSEFVESASKEFCLKYEIHTSDRTKPYRFDECNTMTAYLYPRASPERLFAINNIMCLFWFIDDLCDEDDTIERCDANIKGGDDQGRMQDVLLASLPIFQFGQLPPHATRLQQAIFEMRAALLRLSNESWFNRFVRSVRDYFTETIKNIQLSRNGHALALDEFLDAKVSESAMNLTADFIEFANDLYLPPCALECAPLRQARHKANQTCTFLNDMFSYHKEVIVAKERKDRYNLINVLIERGRTFDDAVHESVRLINSLVHDFISIKAGMPRLGDETDIIVTHYIQGLEDLMAAGWYWQMSTNRYRAPDSPFPELRVRANEFRPKCI
jgi:alpha-muurolene/germacrene-A/gamma-muurolene synthase